MFTNGFYPNESNTEFTAIAVVNKGLDNRSDIIQGLITAWPIWLGYIPLGLAFGVIAQNAGLHPLQIGLMSLLVFVGSLRFIAVSMLLSGAGAASIIFTTFAVNLRHFVMSSSLALYLGELTRFPTNGKELHIGLSSDDYLTCTIHKHETCIFYRIFTLLYNQFPMRKVL